MAMAVDQSVIRKSVEKAVHLIKKSRKTIAFTGAGVSVESGIPDFRGPNGIWSRIDTKYLEIDYFMRHGKECWPVIHKMFFNPLSNARPNPAHHVLAWMEHQNLLSGIITQNIDNLHHKAGNTNVVEFHGNTRILVCPRCKHQTPADFDKLGLPPRCPQCNTILKPDFVFFGENIPSSAWRGTEELLKNLELMIVIGTTGVIFPAGQIPRQAKQSGAFIIEINVCPSEYTSAITDVFIQLPASSALETLKFRLENK